MTYLGKMHDDGRWGDLEIWKNDAGGIVVTSFGIDVSDQIPDRLYDNIAKDYAGA